MRDMWEMIVVFALIPFWLIFAGGTLLQGPSENWTLMKIGCIITTIIIFPLLFLALWKTRGPIPQSDNHSDDDPCSGSVCTMGASH